MIDLLYLAASVAGATAIYRLWAVRLAIMDGVATRVFAGFMSAHALLNLTIRTQGALHQNLAAALVAETSALVFAGTYLAMVWPNGARSIRAGLSLAIAAVSTALLFTATGLIGGSRELIALSAAILGLCVLVVVRDTKPAEVSAEAIARR